VVTPKVADVTDLKILARRLVANEKVLRFEQSTLASGLETPFMIDLHALTPRTLGEIATGVRDIVTERHLAFTHVAGVPTGGDALAKRVARLFPETKIIRLFKDDGRLWVDDQPHFSVGDTVLVVEDVLTTARSAIEATHALAVYGLEIVCVIAICDREQGARAAFEREKCPYEALFTARELLAVARRAHIATEEQYQEATAYLGHWQ